MVQPWAALAAERIMSIFLLLTRLSPQSLHQPKSFETLEHPVADPLRAHTEAWPDAAAHGERTS